VLETQGLLGLAFFEATAFLILLVLFWLLRKDHPSAFFKVWVYGWVCFTLSAFSEVAYLARYSPALRLAGILTKAAALLLFVNAALQFAFSAKRRQQTWPAAPVMLAVLSAFYYLERSGAAHLAPLHLGTAAAESVFYLAAGLLFWRAPRRRSSHGAHLLGGALLLSALHGLDTPYWMQSPVFLLRVAFDHLLGVALGVAAAVVVLEGARSRIEELNDKMRQLTLLTAASTQTPSAQEFLDRVLKHLMESLSSSHGNIRILEGVGSSSRLVIRASSGFTPDYLAQYASLPVSEPWAQKILKSDCRFVRLDEEADLAQRRRMAETGITEMVTLALPGKNGPLGVIAVGSSEGVPFQQDELAYLANFANLVGLTLQNVQLFEDVAAAQHQWAYTFDSIGDPILVHDPSGLVLRTNQRLSQLLGREGATLTGRGVFELLSPKKASFKMCPYCEGLAGEGDEPDPWLPGYFLASNSSLSDSDGKQRGTVHVLKDITERKRAEEKYRTLISSVQEGVFITTPAGRFLDFNEALLRMTGYDNREQLLALDISTQLYVNQPDRERLKKLLNEHGSVADFEFEMRRKDGEVRTMLESSIAVRDASGVVTAYQGFLLDITERKRAEQEIRRRNRELMVLNSIAQTLTESMDLSDSLHRTLRQLAELFSLDASSIYLLEQDGRTLRRAAAVGHRSEYARSFPPVRLEPELLRHIHAVHATFLSAQGLPLPHVLREAQRKEELVSAYIVVLWSKDRVIGALVAGSRTNREFSSADTNLLIAVGSQISSAIQRTLLYDEARQAYENLRRAQEQLLQSEKMVAVGQLISGVAHELNNPLTAILGYSQLLTSSGQVGPQGSEYVEKLYKQAQRTHRIVQNLLSFARQHKPERVLVQINQLVEDTLALRDYDLRINNIRVHLELAQDLPRTAADPHQLQQVFLNIVNNAMDAVLEKDREGEIWVGTGRTTDRVFIEISDSGPGVQDASRVFDPFYTTKPVGKGTGLGLSICYGIVTEHGGTIRVRNRPTRGACFTIELPLQSVAPLALPPESETSASLEGLRILLVDEEVSVLEAMTAILSGHHHQVHAVRTLREACRALESQEFDAIVAEVSCASGTTEFTLSGWLKHNKPQLLQRLIFTCAVAPEGQLAAELLRNGCPLLQKPFKAGDLVLTLETLVSQAAQPAALQG
jgi:PAS domain S-box-containing protein